MEISDVGASLARGFSHVIARPGPIRRWQAGQVATREGGAEKKIGGGVLA